LGAIINLGIDRLATGDMAGRIHEVLEQPSGLARAATDPLVQAILAQALHLAFWGVLALALFAFAASWLIPVSAQRLGSATASTR
jgi:hypothetical protein